MTLNNPAGFNSYEWVLARLKDKSVKRIVIAFAIMAVMSACGGGSDGGGAGSVDLTNKNPNVEESGAKQLSEAPASGASAEAMFRGNANHTGSYEDPGVPSLNGLKWKFAI